MKDLEAKIILRCQRPRYVKQIWQGLVAWDKSDVSYPRIAHKCEEMYLRGYMVRWGRGNKIYYRSTKQAIQEAIAWLNKRGEVWQKEAKALKMMMTNKRITNFI